MPSKAAQTNPKTLLNRALKTTIRLSDAEIHELRALPEYLLLQAPDRLHVEQGYFGVLDDPSVRYNEKKSQYELKYYPSDDATETRWAALRAISTTRSLTDWPYKITIVLFHAFLVVIIGLAPFSKFVLAPFTNIQTVSLGFADASIFLSVGFVLAAICIAWFLFNAFVVGVHLNVASNDWSIALTRSATYGNVHTQMNGARDVLLKMRQFIKWRRFVNFAVPIGAALSIIGVGGFWIGGMYLSLGYLEPNDILWIAPFSWAAMMHGVWLWYRVRVRHTTWRDPTVQLSVMIARMHQRYVENKAGGFKFGGGGTSETSASSRTAVSQPSERS